MVINQSSFLAPSTFVVFIAEFASAAGGFDAEQHPDSEHPPIVVGDLLLLLQLSHRQFQIGAAAMRMRGINNFHPIQHQKPMLLAKKFRSPTL